MAEHYDVIIIGSGAGGGTLAHTLAASGKRILLLERGDFLPREMDNWDPEPVFIDGKYISKDTWYDADGKPFQPQVHYYVGGATKLYGAALYRLRPQDFGEIQHVDGISPAWPLSYDDFEPWYTQGRVAVPGARQRRGGPDRGPPQRAVPVARRLARAADPAAIRRPGQGRLPPVPRAVRDPARRGRAGPGAPASAAPGATATPAWCTPRPTPRTIAVRPLLDLPNVTLLVGAEVTRLETDASGPDGHRRRRLPRRRPRGLHGPTSSSVCAGRGQLRQAPAPLGQRPASPNGLANGSDQVGRNYMFHNCKAVVALAKEPNDTVFQKTLGINDFYLGADGLRVAGRQHPDDRQVQRRGDEGRGAQADQARPALDPGRRGQARGRLLAHDRGPAESRRTG